jgi:lysylphosphatidylglycerol synthetase-like protein (DUF2156 family)
MRRVVALFVAVEAVVLALYVLFLIGWLGAKRAGVNAFPASPDWEYNYVQNQIRYNWLEGMVVGVVIGGLLLAIASRGQVGKLWRAQVATCVTLALGVVVGIVLEINTPIGDASPMQSNSSLEHSRDP